MDRDDRRRYFVVGSVILEIVTPLFRQRLTNDYTSKGIGSLQDFLNSQPVIHILFHLRHKNASCCKDKSNCTNRSSLPLNYSQWDLLYAETNPGINRHYCHCKFTAKPAQTVDLDITLASLILFNCCNIGPADENTIRELQKFKNNYLSHNSKGGITQIEYNSLWTDLTTYILQLDNSKQDDIIRIQRRPLDERLCEEYTRQLLDFYQMLEEMNVIILENNTLIKGVDTLVRRMDASVRRMDTSVKRMDTSVRRMDTSLQGTNADVKETDLRISSIFDRNVTAGDLEKENQNLKETIQRMNADKTRLENELSITLKRLKTREDCDNQTKRKEHDFSTVEHGMTQSKVGTISASNIRHISSDKYIYNFTAATVNIIKS